VSVVSQRSHDLSIARDLAIKNRKPLPGLDRSSGPGGVPDIEVKRRVAALVLAYSRGWSADRVAEHFGWPLEDVTRWIELGKFRQMRRGKDQDQEEVGS